MLNYTSHKEKSRHLYFPLKLAHSAEHCLIKRVILHVIAGSLIALREQHKRRMRVRTGSERSVWGTKVEGGVDPLISSP